MTIRITAVTIAMLIAMAGPLSAQDQEQASPPATTQPADPQAGEAAPELDHISYLLGVNFGLGLKNQGIQPNIQSLFAGIADAYRGQLRLNQQQLADAREDLVAQLQKRADNIQKAAEQNKKAGQEFLAENAEKPDIRTAPEGYQYKVIEKGTGASPDADDTVKVHYEGRFIDGQVFDSSLQRGEPAEFQVNGVIPGWTHALQQMKVGGKWQLFIPPELAYGEQARPNIPPNSTLIFDVELLDVTSNNNEQE